MGQIANILYFLEGNMVVLVLLLRKGSWFHGDAVDAA